MVVLCLRALSFLNIEAFTDCIIPIGLHSEKRVDAKFEVDWIVHPSPLLVVSSY